MSDRKPTYEELEARLAETEAVIEALRSQQVDAIIGDDHVALVRLKEVEDALRESKEYIENVIRSMTESLIVVSPEGAIQTVNAATCAILSYEEKELVGQPVGAIFEEEEELVFKGSGLDDLIKKGAIRSIEKTYLSKDGRKIPVLFSGSVMRDDDGKIQGLVCVALDITERKRADEEIRRRAEEMAALVEMNRAITEDIDLKETLDRILSNAQKIIPVSDCSVTLVDESSEDLVVEASTNGEIGLRISPAAPSAVGWVVKTKQILAEEDVSSNPIFSQQLVQEYGFKSGLAVPIIYKDKVIGALSFGNRHVRRAFSDSEKMMAQAFAYQAAIAIQNARLFEAERNQRELAEALQEAAAAVSRTLDLDEVLDHILEQVSRVVPNDATNIMLIEGDQARIVRWRGHERFGAEDFVSIAVFRVPELPTLQRMVETEEPLVVPDTVTYPGWVHVPVQEWLRSYAGAPIIVRGEVIGFLNVDSATPGFFTQAHTGALRAFAEHAATAIGNARLYEGIQQKAEELELLLDTVTATSSTLELDHILRALADKMTTSVRATFCRIALLDEMNQTLTIRAAFAAHDLDWDPGLGRQYASADAPWHRQAIEGGETMILRQDDPSQAVSETECRIALTEDIQSALLIPLVIGDRTLGVISLGEMRGWERVPFTADQVRLCQAMGNQTAIAIRNAQLLNAGMKHRRDLQRLSTELINAQEDERRRLSRELHDEMGQALTMMSINLAAIEKELPSELAPTIRERLAETTSLADQTLDQIRELSLDLRPSTLDELGLVPTLRWYVNRYTRRLNIEVELEAIDFEERLTPEMETAVYRVVQEALTNVARHAQASRVHVRLERKESAVVAFINDNGKGFDAEKITGSEAPEHGVGLLGIRERVSSLGGSFSIQSGPGQGTRLTIEIPLHWGEGS